MTRNLVFGGLALGGVVLALSGAQHLMRSDPFERYEGRGKDAAIKLKNVEIKHWNRGQLMSQAKADEVTVAMGLATFDLSGVHDGVFYGDEGRIDFTAEEAKWNSNKLILSVDKGATLKHEDFDLRVPSFTIDRKTTEVVVPREIKGRLLGGRVSASNFRYKMADGSYRVGPAMWIGNATFQEGAQPGAGSKWTFKADGGTRRKRDVEIWEKATATDGDIVVQGDQTERNVKTDVITVMGNVLYFSPKANMACDKAVVYRKEKRAVLTGNVRMLVKPKDSMERKLEVGTGEIPPFRPLVPDSVASSRPATTASQEDKALDEEIRSGKTTRKYPVVVLATNVDYWYGKGNRRAIVTGSPQASQQLAGERWRKAWADKVLYDGEKETMRLVSTDGKKDVRMKTSLGDDLLALWFELSTAEDNDEWSASGMEGTVVSDDEELNEATKDAKTDEKPVEPAPTPPQKEDGPPPSS